MIKNNKQLQVTSEKLLEFKEALEILKGKNDINPILQEIQMGALIAQIEIFESDIKEYSLLKEQKIACLTADSLLDLGSLLIKARVLKGWSHNQLASKLNMKAQQIQRYEAENYETASLPKLISVAAELGLNFYPIKARIEKQEFLLPQGLTLQKVQEAQSCLSREKSLLPLGAAA